eukprot:3425902-Rhodomonas_salina.3
MPAAERSTLYSRILSSPRSFRNDSSSARSGSSTDLDGGPCPSTPAPPNRQDGPSGPVLTCAVVWRRRRAVCERSGATCEQMPFDLFQQQQPVPALFDAHRLKVRGGQREDGGAVDLIRLEDRRVVPRQRLAELVLERLHEALHLVGPIMIV